ncbi:MAG: hypothetical protein IKY94_05265 [Lachnospiraceae bacterium]|nr:hypothetical protein [Lachnospiraceae bacterium]
MEKILCINKIRDARGNITSYVLKKENGAEFKATAKQIKAEITAKNYDFVNLQIDKAERLVDKALPKQQVQKQQKPVAQTENFYTFDELIRNVDPKGRKVRCYDTNTGKYVVGEGVALHTSEEEAHNCIRVYIAEKESEMTVSLKPLKDLAGFWKKYSDTFPYEYRKNWHKTVEPTEEDYKRIKEFCEQNAKEYNLKLSFGNHGYKVDCKPNPAGRYTVVAIGKPKDSKLYKIRDNREGKEYWKSIEDLDYSPESNEFTNIAVVRNIRKFAKNIPEVEVGEVLKKKDACINKIKQEIRKNIQSSGITVTEDEVMVGDFKGFEETCKKVEKLWNTLELEDSFKDMLFEAVEGITDYEEHPQTLYYGCLDGMEETYYSYDPEDVKRSLGAIIQDCIHSMGEDCTELEAKRRVYDLIRTNINHDFVIDDDEEDWDED